MGLVERLECWSMKGTCYLPSPFTTPNLEFSSFSFSPFFFNFSSSYFFFFFLSFVFAVYLSYYAAHQRLFKPTKPPPSMFNHVMKIMPAEKLTRGGGPHPHPAENIPNPIPMMRKIILRRSFVEANRSKK